MNWKSQTLYIMLIIMLLLGFCQKGYAEDYSFSYCYDCWKDPNYPLKGNSCYLYNIANPLASDGDSLDSIEGNWKLIYIGLYEDQSDVGYNIQTVANEIKDSYNLQSIDKIPMYKLMNGETYITYGFLLFYTDDNKAVFIGDTQKGWASYLLSPNTITDSFIAPIKNDINDFIQDDTTVYTVTLTNDGHGTASASPKSGPTGTEVTLTAEPDDGYIFKEWQVIAGNVTVTDNSFSIGTEDVEIKAIFEEESEIIYKDSFRYCYDCWKDPNYPLKGNSCYLYNIANPLASDGDSLDSSKGNWKLIYIGLYEDQSDVGYNIQTVANEMKDSYNLQSIDKIPMYKLMNGETYITYGFLLFYTDDNKAVFIGDTQKGWASYLLSPNTITDSFIAPIKNDINDFIEDSPTIYTVTLTNDGRGTATASPDSGPTGTEVTLTAEPDDGYIFKEWQVIAGDVTITDNSFMIGTEDVVINAVFEEASAEIYTVTLTNDGHGTASASPDSGPTGTSVILTAEPNDGYIFKEWQVIAGDVTITDNSFMIGTEDVVINAVFEEASAEIYTVTLTNDGNGTASASPDSGPTGTSVILTAEPDDGYIFKEWLVIAGDVTITDNSFVIGTEDVKIKAIFAKDVTDVMADIYFIDRAGNRGLPIDINETSIDLTLKINKGKREISSAKETLTLTPEIKIMHSNFGFSGKLKFLSDPGRYSVKASLSKDKVAQYNLSIKGDPEIYVDKKGETRIRIYILWKDSTLEYMPETIVVYALPEDEIGAYTILDDGTKEYLLFHTYDICMRYLGRDDLCSGFERCFHKELPYVYEKNKSGIYE